MTIHILKIDNRIKDALILTNIDRIKKGQKCSSTYGKRTNQNLYLKSDNKFHHLNHCLAYELQTIIKVQLQNHK